jgi:hypothetical protein
LKLVPRDSYGLVAWPLKLIYDIKNQRFSQYILCNNAIIFPFITLKYEFTTSIKHSNELLSELRYTSCKFFL